jgi:hypothetical protein
MRGGGGGAVYELLEFDGGRAEGGCAGYQGMGRHMT